MNLSIASYSFHGLRHEGMIDIFGYLESMRYRYQVTAADIWSGFLPTLDDDYLKKVRRALDERDLPLANLCVDGPYLWDDDPDVRAQHVLQMQQWLRAAEVLGAKTFRIDAGGRDATYSSEQREYIVNQYCAYAQYAFDHGFRIGPENHWGTEVDPENMRQIYEGVNHPGFGVLLHYGRSPKDDMLIPWAMHTHFSAAVDAPATAHCVDLLRQAGYSGCYSIELGTGQDEYQAAAAQLAQLQATLAALTESK